MDSPRAARIAITIFFFISGFGFSSWASRIPDIQHKLNLNEAQLGSILFALPLGLILTLPVTGILLQRYSSRNIMMVGALVFNLMLALIGFASTSWQLVIVLFCFGCSRNLMNISMNAQSIGVQTLFSKSIITTFHGVWSLAGFGGALIGLLMVNLTVPTSWHFLAVGLSMVVLGFFAFPTSLHQPPSTSSGKRLILPDKHLLKFGLVSFAVMSCEGTMYDWSGIYFQKAVHAPKGIVTAGYVAYMIAMATGRFSGDKLVHKWGIPTIIKYSGLLIFCGLLLAALFPSPIPAGIGFMMTGVGVSCVVPLVFSMAGRSKSMGSGSAIAAVSTVGYLGFLMVPPVVGFLAEAAGLRWSFAIIACLGMVISWLISRVKEEA
ncbi:Fucose permease [Chitinophaga sp. CF118]|uniref:MFS transporter n=1 Tax=Chitinophaga sp. CF118 TaxID=1884367 RepID=UPI0008E4B25C|nr:MFS transporter [Chitinophaga sp. CF118]SFD76144.1 Fucose permease [Chitinophaga sp. CF118]